MALQRLRKMAFDLPVGGLTENVPRVPARDVAAGKIEKFNVGLVGEVAAQILIPGNGHCRYVFGKLAQLLGALAQCMLGLLARSDVGADAAVARELARG